jgi:hypothetical protein
MQLKWGVPELRELFLRELRELFSGRDAKPGFS